MNNSEVILHVDDDLADCDLLEIAFRRTACPGQLKHVVSGIEALLYLRGEGAYADRQQFPFPKYIITDLKMPGMDGMLLLKILRSDSHWSTLSVVVLTGSADEDDIKQSFLQGANAFFTKRIAMRDATQLFRVINEFMDLGEHPRRDERGNLIPTNSAGKLGHGLTLEPRAPSPDPADAPKPDPLP